MTSVHVHIGGSERNFLKYSKTQERTDSEGRGIVMFRIHERNIAEHREGDRGTSGMKEYKKQM
jgi:hypothetical protein